MTAASRGNKEAHEACDSLSFPRGPMTGESAADASRRPSFSRKIWSWLLIIPSMILGILVAELFCHVFPPPSTAQGFDMRMRRVVFFDGSDTVFRNQGDIFTYVPRSGIRNVTGFFSDNDFNVEYDYHFQTNNFGLVQDADIAPERDSLVLLGDSFTEGQGAEPWFRLVSPEIAKLGYQTVNGGIMGTCFAQRASVDP